MRRRPNTIGSLLLNLILLCLMVGAVGMLIVYGSAARLPSTITPQQKIYFVVDDLWRIENNVIVERGTDDTRIMEADIQSQTVRTIFSMKYDNRNGLIGDYLPKREKKDVEALWVNVADELKDSYPYAGYPRLDAKGIKQKIANIEMLDPQNLLVMTTNGYDCRFMLSLRDCWGYYEFLILNTSTSAYQSIFKMAFHDDIIDEWDSTHKTSCAAAISLRVVPNNKYHLLLLNLGITNRYCQKNHAYIVDLSDTPQIIASIPTDMPAVWSPDGENLLVGRIINGAVQLSMYGTANLSLPPAHIIDFTAEITAEKPIRSRWLNTEEIIFLSFELPSDVSYWRVYNILDRKKYRFPSANQLPPQYSREDHFPESLQIPFPVVLSDNHYTYQTAKTGFNLIDKDVTKILLHIDGGLLSPDPIHNESLLFRISPTGDIPNLMLLDENLDQYPVNLPDFVFDMPLKDTEYIRNILLGRLH